jgi:hypothetical protein
LPEQMAPIVTLSRIAAGLAAYFAVPMIIK